MKQWAWILAVCAGIAGCNGDGHTTPPPRTDRTIAPPPSAQSAQSAQATAPAAPAAEANPDDEPVATIGEITITRQELLEPLIQAHGLDFLLQLATYELARATAERNGLSVTEQDVTAEADRTISRMFQDAPKEDYDRLLEQFLSQQNLSEEQFNLVMRTNAYLRAIVVPMVEERITEQSLRQAFGALYGETVRVRHIQLANMQEVAEAQRRLAAGEAFEDVARDLSRNARTAPLGGELPPFSRQMQGLPDSFKEAAFALETGEVSDAVLSDGSYHLIKLEERIPPKAVEFEDHRDAVHEQLADSMTTQGMKQLRNQLAQEAMQRIDIRHPALAEQFQQRIRASQLEAAERDEVLRDLERQRQRREEQAPTTAPAPAAAPAAKAATTQAAPIEANK